MLRIPMSVGVAGEHGVEERGGAGEGGDEIGLDVHSVSHLLVRVGPYCRGHREAIG